jgi:SOS-response transcriptional repressor LexA
VPPVGLLIIGRVVAGMPILGAENLDRRPESHRLCEERSNLFVLYLQGDSMVDPQIDAGDDGIVRAQLWVEHRDVGGDQ